MNKKICLIALGFLLILLGTRAGLTKSGIIPNRFGINALCSCINCEQRHFELIKGDIPQLSGKECCNGTYTVEWRKPCTKFGDQCRVQTI